MVATIPGVDDEMDIQEYGLDIDGFSNLNLMV